MDLTAIGYILFVIPGFLLIWTYRHFTKAPTLGGFEYAAWSFVWGVVLLFLSNYLFKFSGQQLPQLPTGDELSLSAVVLGTAMGISTIFSFSLGYLGAILSKFGLFRWINKVLSKFTEK